MSGSGGATLAVMGASARLRATEGIIRRTARGMWFGLPLASESGGRLVASTAGGNPGAPTSKRAGALAAAGRGQTSVRTSLAREPVRRPRATVLSHQEPRGREHDDHQRDHCNWGKPAGGTTVQPNKDRHHRDQRDRTEQPRSRRPGNKRRPN